MNPVFYNDNDTLGNAASYGSPYLRDVSVRIDGNFQSNLPAWGYDNNAEGIQTVLNSKGWIAEQVTNVSSGWFPGISGFSYEIFAVVGVNYTDREIQDNLRRDLSGFFNVTGISTTSSAYTPPTGTAYVPPGQTPPPVIYGTPTPGATPTPTQGTPTSIDNFVSDFASGLGFSTPMILLGGAVLLVLIMKR